MVLLSAGEKNYDKPKMLKTLSTKMNNFKIVVNFEIYTILYTNKHL